MKNKPVANRYRVPKSLWRSFKTEDSKRMFNLAMKAMNQVPQSSINVAAKNQVYLSDKSWKTVKHNLSCLIAWQVRREQLSISKLKTKS